MIPNKMSQASYMITEETEYVNVYCGLMKRGKVSESEYGFIKDIKHANLKKNSICMILASQQSSKSRSSTWLLEARRL